MQRITLSAIFWFLFPSLATIVAEAGDDAVLYGTSLGFLGLSCFALRLPFKRERWKLAYALIAFMTLPIYAQSGALLEHQPDKDIDAYIQPYLSGGNFSGDILIEKGGKIVFEHSYGLANRERVIVNRPASQFHVASMSMLFTATAVLRLVDQGAISLDTRVSDFAPRITGSDKITVRDLLTERSGIPDINNLASYDEILRSHQTPSTLVSKIEGQPLLFEPGSKFLHEEHSAYNLLALIVEKKSGLPFGTAVEQLVLKPAHLTQSHVDDDSTTFGPHIALGYEPNGTYGLKPAASIHWSAKTGNGSVITTARDEAKLVNAIFTGTLLSAKSREAMLDKAQLVGYGWFKNQSKKFGQPAYYMNGRAPGFASFMLHLPQSELTIIVLSNIYSSSTTTIGFDITSILLGLPYDPFRPRSGAPDLSELKSSIASFQFGGDFYQPNAKLTSKVNNDGLSLLWPAGDVSPLIPLEHDHYLDRTYWIDVRVERGPDGRVTDLLYGQFKGLAVEPN